VVETKQMFVVWKRPDGFHGATPADFRVVDVGGQARIWLHHSDTTNFPFRVSGGWQESEATHRLNSLVNMIDKPRDAWVTYLLSLFNNSMADEPSRFFSDKLQWLAEVKSHLKGDTWEVEIMSKVVQEVIQSVESVKDAFMKRAGS